MDFTSVARLRARMAETSTIAPHDDLLRRLFYLLTARFEEGAEIAADGQAKGLETDAQVALANRIRATAEEVIILTGVVAALAASLEAQGQHKMSSKRRR